jgi:hypothetical protein
MSTNKENRTPKPQTEGEKHQGVGVNTPSKDSAKPRPEQDGNKDSR